MSTASEAVVNAGTTTKTEGVLWHFHFELGSTKVTAKGVYRDQYENWMNRCPTPGSPHPDIPALSLKEIDANRIEGDLIDVNLGYECNDPDAQTGRGGGKIKRYHMEPGAGEEPLLTNDLFKDLSETEQEAANGLINSGKTKADFETAKTALTSAAALKLLSKVRKGVEAYRNPSLVWIERFTTNTLNDVELSKILKTTSNPPGNAPAPGENRNYLRLPPLVSPHDDGKTWDIENRWELSLKGKWDPDIYPAGG